MSKCFRQNDVTFIETGHSSSSSSSSPSYLLLLSPPSSNSSSKGPHIVKKSNCYTHSPSTARNKSRNASTARNKSRNASIALPEIQNWRNTYQPELFHPSKNLIQLLTERSSTQDQPAEFGHRNQMEQSSNQFETQRTKFLFKQRDTWANSM